MLWTDATDKEPSSLRIFVSSTFRDMASERDLLARRVFPRLRQSTEAHGAPLCEIDLRWGITSEEASEGRVIELCLAEIDACRPFFFCMLGDRYGWIDPWAAERLSRFPHLLGFADRSVTELEIRHGALGPNAPPPDRCFFYLRSPAYLDRLPDGADRRNFVPESPLHRERLEALKTEIRASGYPVREYSDLERFRDLVEQDLQSAIAPVVQSVAIGANEAGQRAFITARAAVYAASAATQTVLDRSQEQRRPVVLVGAPGSGKSAALAHWLHRRCGLRPEPQRLWDRLLRRGGAKPAPIVLCHFADVEPDAEDWLPVLEGVLSDLKRQLELRQPIARTPESAIAQFQSWLGSLASDRRVILVLDGLDRAYRRSEPPLLDWLPSPLPKGVDIVLTARDGDLARALGERGCLLHTLPALGPDEIRNVVNAYLAGFGKRLPDDSLEAVARTPQCANPLFVRTVADELRQFGSHERLRGYLDAYLACRDATDLFSRLLRRLDQDFRFDERTAAGDALALIVASRGGLAESELLALLGEEAEPMPARPWAELRQAINPHLVDRRGRIDIGPSALRAAVAAARLPTDSDWRRARLRIVEYFARRQPTPRAVQELPWQLGMLGEWDRLAAVLADPQRLILGLRYCPRDLTAYWRELQVRGRDIATAYAPLLANPMQDADASFSLAKLLFELGRYEPALPLAQAIVAQGRTDARSRLDAKSLLAGILIELGALSDALSVLGQLRQDARSAGDEAALSVCLGDLALCAARLGNPAGALAYHAEEEALCRAANDMIGLGQCLGNYARDLLAAGEQREALARWREQQAVARKWNQHAMLCSSLYGQARALIALRQPAHALGQLEAATALHREAGEDREARRCLLLTAKAKASAGDGDGAFAVYGEIERSAAASDDPESIALARLGTAELFLAFGRALAAKGAVQKALNAVARVPDARRRAELHDVAETIMRRTA